MKHLPLNKQPNIDYPCRWVFKLFGKDMDLLREAVGRIMPAESYSLTLSRSSRHDKYHCMNLELTVVSDEDRHSIYEALTSHPDILLVL